MKKLIIAEKPSVAKDIAKVLNCKGKKDGYIEGEDYIVTWAIGHLVILCNPEEYDIQYKKWALNNLPILPEKIKLKPNTKTYKQYQIVKGLLNSSNVNEVICATDAGREGELIFRYLYELANCRKPFKRLWISSLTEEAINEGFANLKDGKIYDPLYYSAKCRSESDWLVGINGSRAYSIKYNSLLPIGRVQTPTLKIIVDRDLDIDNFNPMDYWEVKANFQEYNGIWIDLNLKESKIDHIEKAELIKNKVLGKEGKVTDCQKKKVVKKPPLLYDLTELQRDANKRYGYTAQRTLDIAQALYEKRKAITYPRTDSRYLSKDLVPKFKALIKKVGLEGYKEYTDILEKLDKLPVTSRIVNDRKVSDHHAIIPTEKRANLDRFTDEEKNIYDIKGIKDGEVEVIACVGNFHGRTIGAVSMSSEEEYRRGFGPLLSGITLVPYGDLEALKVAITPNTAAFIMEPIQGEAGIILPPDGFLKAASDLCKENNVLLIADEIQVGIGRTGKMFACEWEHVEPDMYILGKALGGGVFPISCVAANSTILDVFNPGSHGSTFGGNPLACAVSIAALEVIEEENLVERSLKLGNYFLEQLKKINNPIVKEVRGKGLFIGVVLTEKARPYCEALKEEGLLCKETHDTVIRFAPPLIISQEELDWAIAKIHKVLG